MIFVQTGDYDGVQYNIAFSYLCFYVWWYLFLVFFLWPSAKSKHSLLWWNFLRIRYSVVCWNNRREIISYLGFLLSKSFFCFLFLNLSPIRVYDWSWIIKIRSLISMLKKFLLDSIKDYKTILNHLETV